MLTSGCFHVFNFHEFKSFAGRAAKSVFVKLFSFWAKLGFQWAIGTALTAWRSRSQQPVWGRHV